MLIALSAGAFVLAPCALIPAAAADAPNFGVRDWSGFYFGANVGRIKAQVNEGVSHWYDGADYTVFGESSSGQGMIGGLGVGYNLQSGRFVYGAEFDASITNWEAKGFAANRMLDYGATDPLRSRTRVNVLFTGRARVGYAVSDFLLYATAGLAAGEVKRTVTQYYTDPANFAWGDGWMTYDEPTSFRNFKTGFTLGAGVEKAISDNLTARLQYSYADFGKRTYHYSGYPYLSLIHI